MNKHNSVEHAFSLANWSEICGLVDVLTIVLLSPTREVEWGPLRDILWIFPLSHYRIDNVGDYLHLKNGSFKFKVDRPQFNMRLDHFSQISFNVIKTFSKRNPFRSAPKIIKGTRWCRCYIAVLSSWAVKHFDFAPWPFRPKGYCRCLRLSVCPSVKFTLSAR